EPARWVYQRPTFLLTLTKDGVCEEGQRKIAWAGKKRPDFSHPGVYRLEGKGSLARIAEPPIPFPRQVLLLVVSRTVRTQAKVLAIRREAMRKQQAGTDLANAAISLREDDNGNGVVRFRTMQGREWSNEDWTVVVKTDGKADRPSLREVKTC